MWVVALICVRPLCLLGGCGAADDFQGRFDDRFGHGVVCEKGRNERTYSTDTSHTGKATNIAQ